MTHHIDQTFVLLNRALGQDRFRDELTDLFEKHADLIDGERVIPVGTAADLIVDNFPSLSDKAALSGELTEVTAERDRLWRVVDQIDTLTTGARA